MAIFVFFAYQAYTRTTLKLVASQQTPFFSTYNIIGSLSKPAERHRKGKRKERKANTQGSENSPNANQKPVGATFKGQHCHEQHFFTV